MVFQGAYSVSSNSDTTNTNVTSIEIVPPNVEIVPPNVEEKSKKINFIQADRKTIAQYVRKEKLPNPYFYEEEDVENLTTFLGHLHVSTKIVAKNLFTFIRPFDIPPNTYKSMPLGVRRMDAMESFVRPGMPNVRSCHAPIPFNKHRTNIAYLRSPCWATIGIYSTQPSSQVIANIQSAYPVGSKIPRTNRNYVAAFNVFYATVNNIPCLCVSRVYGAKAYLGTYMRVLAEEILGFNQPVLLIDTQLATYQTSLHFYGSEVCGRADRRLSVMAYSPPFPSLIGAVSTFRRYPDIRSSFVQSNTGNLMEVHSCLIIDNSDYLSKREIAIFGGPYKYEALFIDPSSLYSPDPNRTAFLTGTWRRV